MTDIQKGTTSLPVIIKPRIEGIAVTQTAIKQNYSNRYVDDPSTPLTWTLEYRKAGSTLTSTLAFDSSKSTDTEIFFNMPDSFYAEIADWTLLVYWQIDTEKIYNDEAMTISIKEFHLTS